MRFHIFQVAPQMFRNYTFYVYNDVGHAEHAIHLFRGILLWLITALGLQNG